MPADMTYSDWQTVYIEKTVSPEIWKQAKENFAHHDFKNGIIEVEHTTLKDKPYSVTKYIARKGGVDWNFYDANGKQYLQVSDNPHGHKKEAKFGRHGEHAHFLDLYAAKPDPHGEAVEVPWFVRKKIGDLL